MMHPYSRTSLLFSLRYLSLSVDKESLAKGCKTEDRGVRNSSSSGAAASPQGDLRPGSFGATLRRPLRACSTRKALARVKIRRNAPAQLSSGFGPLVPCSVLSQPPSPQCVPPWVMPGRCYTAV